MSFDEWQETKLGDVLTLKRGYDLPQSNRVAGSVPIYSSAGLSGFHNEAKVKGPGVITGRYGTLGEVFFAEQDYWPHNTTLYVQNFKGNDPKFVFYFLKTLGFANNNDKTSVPGLNRNDLHEINVRIPSNLTQKRIVSILSSLDDKMELNRQTNQTLEAIAQAIFKEWFVDFNFPGATGKMQDSELGEIPKGWKVSHIGELFDFVIGGDWGKENEQPEFQNKCAVMRGTDLDDILNANTSKVPIRFIKNSNLTKRELKEGDIVFEISGGSKDQATGRNLLVTKELLDLFPYKVIPASFCRLIRAKDFPTAIFLGTFLRIFYAEGGTWDFQLQSTGISNFQFGYFEEKKLIALPEMDLIKSYSNKIQPLYHLIGENIKQTKTLTQLRDSLLPKLMKGELKLNSNQHANNTNQT